jgi:hypothetical protein
MPACGRSSRPEAVDTAAPSRDFIILRPGAAYVIEITVSLPVTCAPGGQVKGVVGAGEHLLRVTVGTWYESRKLGEALRERWKRKGLLWIDNVVSEPVRFSTETSGAVVRCP